MQATARHHAKKLRGKFAAKHTPRTKSQRREKLSTQVGFVAPLLVCGVVATGLLYLAAENLGNSIAARDFRTDHSIAIQRIFFRN